MNRREFLGLGGVGRVKSVPVGLSGRVTRNTSLNEHQAASRFLAQATLGATRELIDEVAEVGVEGWIEQQFAIPQTETLAYMWDVIEPLYRVEDVPLLGLEPFRWAWWQAAMRGADVLRQRVAMALSEIMVVSSRTDFLEDLSTVMGSWYDMLLKHAFGNFGDLLLDVTLHPAMGYYLSHAGNRKADPAVNRFPDENYAREVMQLFSIGLFELNVDGSRKLDGRGEPIPTYDNGDVAEFAKVFTGLTYAWSVEWEEEDIGTDTAEGFAAAEMSWDNGVVPMEMYGAYHEPGVKRLLNGFVVPAGQSGLTDVEMTIDHLFNHANVGPFMARLLIQRLVKSQPSPAYIARVATAFNDNGRGVRGDMKAVVKAILLDDEARNSAFINDPTHGMMREPFMRYTQLCRALEAYNEGGEELFFNSGEEGAEALGQYPFMSPSVFNFFSPDYQPLGALAGGDVDAPEFQIATSVSVTKRINFWEDRIFYNEVMTLPKGRDADDEEVERMPDVSDVVLNLDLFEGVRGDVGALLDGLDLLFTYGSLSSEMRAILLAAMAGLYELTGEWEDVVKMGVFLLVSCPEYVILR